ncbi:MAG: diguanylate cyclase [Pseudomonadota bacterium]
MNSFDDIETASGYASQAVQLMKDHNLPATPQNYAVWYAYASGNKPDLNKVLDEALSEGASIPESVSRAIYEQFVGDDQRDTAVLEAGETLTNLAEDIKGMVTQASDDAAIFSTALADGAGSLVGVTDPQAVGTVVQVLATRTQKMIEQNASLQTKLDESAQEAAGLRERLVSVQKEALTDGLTGIANRKCFDMSLRSAMEEAAKSSAPLSLILTDIDHFKKFNDTHGHQTGDHVLRFVAQMLQRTVKSQDTAARYGGEEFAVILPNTDLNVAMAIAESVRTGVAAKHLRKKQTGDMIGNINLSLGVAKFRKGESAVALLKRADDGLYLAKRTGRNKTVAETELDAVAD